MHDPGPLVFLLVVPLLIFFFAGLLSDSLERVAGVSLSLAGLLVAGVWIALFLQGQSLSQSARAIYFSVGFGLLGCVIAFIGHAIRQAITRSK
jgi:hypothetical protein